jgi:hypothetical protein
VSTGKLELAGGGSVPSYLVEALHTLETRWPGASAPQARPAIVSAILEAQKKYSRAKKQEASLVFVDSNGTHRVIGTALFDKATGEATMQVDSPRYFIILAENADMTDNDEETPE